MAYAVAVLNTVLGTVYTCYGLITIVDMKRGWRTNGFSHFGAAWLAMAFTCGPHHLDHGLHIFLSGRGGGWLDLVTIAVGFPAGVIWFLLRVEAMFGGRGDRHITGTPVWLEAMPVVGGSASRSSLGCGAPRTTIVAALSWVESGSLTWRPGSTATGAPPSAKPVAPSLVVTVGGA